MNTGLEKHALYRLYITLSFNAGNRPPRIIPYYWQQTTFIVKFYAYRYSSARFEFNDYDGDDVRTFSLKVCTCGTNVM